MPVFNLPWRASPRGRPSIKSASYSASKSVSHSASATVAAELPSKSKPVSPHISKLRRAQQALIGRRRRVSNRNGKVRVSFQRSSTSSGLPLSGTRNSVAASRHPSTKTDEAFNGPGPWVT